MHAASQVQTEVHGLGAQCDQPFRCRGRQVQRHRVVLAQGNADQVTCLQLRVGVVEPDQDAVGAEFGGFGLDAVLLEHLFDPLLQRGVDRFVVAGGHLQGRILAKQVRRGVDHA